MNLPNDVARCAGFRVVEDGVTHWREGCETCMRRTAPPSTSAWAAMMRPPEIIAFQCEYLIEPEETK